MATVVHGCGSPSPRQHHGSNISGSVNGCLTGSYHQQHQTTTPKYPTLAKYTRSSAPPQMTTPNHHHVYGGNNPSSGHQYNPPLPPVTYLPVGAASQQHSMQQAYASQRPSSASAAVDACRNYWGHPHAATMMYRSGRHHSKRKSAVELLAETKPFYIKSDAVMERLQQSSYRATSIASGNKRGRNSLDNRDNGRYNPSYGETTHTAAEMEQRFVQPAPAHMHQTGPRGMHMHHHHHHNHHSHGGRHSMSSSNNLLQSKLRMLLSAEASRERNNGVSRANDRDRYRNELPHQFDFGTKPVSGKELSSVAFATEDDSTLRLPPPSFLSPQSFDYNYGVESSSIDEPLVLTENYRPISPPAEYAAESNQTNNEQRSRYNYQRSYSHSHEMAAENATDEYNINSHKSLPDLHSQISRHSPHSEILSCCSRGNRSIKSAGESSLNRDSGGSSGHYTHRSEPCYRQRESEMYASKNCCNPATPMEFRRDSGSSTQHSANSYCGYASPSYTRTAAECAECRCKNTVHFESSDYLLNFTTPEVPEAFQDDYTPPSPSVHKYKSEEPRYSSSSSQKLLNSSQGYTSGGKHSQNSIVQSPGSAPSVEDLSPPPIQFKRQRCIRFKNRSRISLPSTSIHSSAGNESGEPYHRSDREQSTFFFPKCFSADSYQMQEKSLCEASPSSDLDHVRESECLNDLERFFDRLGLNDDKFHEIYSLPKRRRSAETESDDSSTVFFSDVSTVDSMRLPDSTETQPQTTQTYRPSEPPSIVERNARIIKWLCNCRKLQYT